MPSYQVKDEKPPAPTRKILGDEEDEPEDEDDADDNDGDNDTGDGKSGGGMNADDLVDRTSIRLVMKQSSSDLCMKCIVTQKDFQLHSKTILKTIRAIMNMKRGKEKTRTMQVWKAIAMP